MAERGGNGGDMDDSFYREDEGYSGELGEDQFQGTARSTVVQNQPHDEEVNLSESESFAGGDEPPNVPRDASLIESHDMDDGPAAPARTISPEAYDNNAAKHGGTGTSGEWARQTRQANGGLVGAG
ncbi:Intraflagellar transport protein 46 [Tetrabaena socialis]|uniref:Intraflagellar transport protein 46 n=1 Tax=Tetrabaena socialis TaxID=47790 RepID=A0A2J7ZMI8_9CHLO|nr:Intraflagellar transport protein 46 [Tetrabaena socialis]|eukprot:PNH01483.1 Intraflagellar transport protein 46 [Tetrabaena socialis]